MAVPSDTLLGAAADDGSLLVRAAVTTALCEEARGRHGASPTAAAALGRALTAAVLLGGLLKGRQSILLQWRGGGPLGPVVAEGRGDCAVRGYVGRPAEDLPRKNGKLDVGGGVGRDGRLVVVRDLGLKEPYTSAVPLQTGEMGEDLAYYLLASEQIPSAVGLGVYLGADGGVAAAGGFLVEALPGAADDALEQVQRSVEALGAVTERLRAGEGSEGLVARILGDVPHRTYTIGTPRFECPCGPDRLDRALAALGEGEARRILDERGQIEIHCAFCASRWTRQTEEGDWVRQDPRS